MSAPGGKERWTREEDNRLRVYVNGMKRPDPKLFPGRSSRAITRRLERLTAGAASIGDRSTADLLADIYDFIKRWRLAKTQFGSMSVRSPGLVKSIEQGRQVGDELEKRIRNFMAKGDPRPKGRGTMIARRYHAAVRANRAAEDEQRMFRATDLVERAKTFIRQRTVFTCFNAEILKPAEVGRFYIGTRIVSRDELLAFARAKGWDG